MDLERKFFEKKCQAYHILGLKGTLKIIRLNSPASVSSFYSISDRWSSRFSSIASSDRELSSSRETPSAV